MRSRFTLILLLSAALPVPGFSQTPRTVASATVSGNSVLRSSEVLDLVRMDEGDRVTEADRKSGEELLDSAYRDRGYCYAQAHIRLIPEAADSTLTHVVVELDEGEFFPVLGIRIEGTAAVPAQDLRSSFETVEGSPLRASALERDLQSMLHRYATAGYPLATAGVREITIDSGAAARGIGVVIEVDEGPRIVVEEARIRGNTETRDDVILRAARIPVGEPYNADKVRSIVKRLNRLNIFASVAEPQLYRTGEAGGGLLITVVEGPTNSFDGVLGYAPRSEGAEGFVSGLVNVAMRNLFGSGRQFAVRWQRDDRLSQEVDLRYGEPWLFGSPVSLGVEFFQRQQESTYVRRILSFHASMAAYDEVTLAGHVSFEETIPSDVPAAFAALDESRTLLAGAGIGYDTRDHPVSPTAGAMFRTDVEVGTKTLQRPGTEIRMSVQTVSMDAEAYVMAFPRQVIAAALHGRERLGGEISLAERYRLGGARSLRGFREGQFLGSRIAWATLEYRHLLAPRSYVFGFIDAGYYFVPPDDVRGVPSSQALKEGYGIGARTDTPLGSLGLSVAVGGGDPFSQAKLHVGLINEF